jgi:hypothetical protein
VHEAIVDEGLARRAFAALDARVRLHAWLDQHYHRSPHAGLMGRTPEAACMGQPSACVPVTAEHMQQAYATRATRRVRRDSTLEIEGRCWELDVRHLAGKTVQLVTWLPPFDQQPPQLEHEGRMLPLTPVNPLANAARGRQAPPPKPPTQPTGFNPAQTALRQATGRTPRTRRPA